MYEDDSPWLNPTAAYAGPAASAHNIPGGDPPSARMYDHFERPDAAGTIRKVTKGILAAALIVALGPLVVVGAATLALGTGMVAAAGMVGAPILAAGVAEVGALAAVGGGLYAAGAVVANAVFGKPKPKMR